MQWALSSVGLSMLWWSVVEDIADGGELVGRMLRWVGRTILTMIVASGIRRLVVLLGKAVAQGSGLNATVATELSMVWRNNRARSVLLSVRQAWSGWESL